MELGFKRQVPQSDASSQSRTGLDRLRERLRKGDPDLTDDELQAAIERVQAKRQELARSQSTDESAKVLAMLPRAAELYRRQIDAGLEKDPELAQKARVILRELLGPIQPRPEPDGSLWADFTMQPAALVKMAAGTDGRGEPICRVPAVPLDARLK